MILDEKYTKSTEDSESPNFPVIIMAGGIGKRATSIDSTIPKPLIQINGKPVLQWEIECLVAQGYTEILLTVSHMAEKIETYFGDGTAFGCTIEYFEEERPLGNAGALFKLWEKGKLEGDFLLLNADSMFDIDFDRFVSFHRSHKALVSLFVHPNSHPYDSGLIITDNQDRVIEWLAKEDERPQWYHNCVNAGLHILNTKVFSFLVSSGMVSVDQIGKEGKDGKPIKIDLDRQVLKPFCKEDGYVYAYSSPEYVKDMGTPERFEQVCADLTSGAVHAKNLSQPQKAVFLDRDGVINQYVGFLRNVSDFELLDSVAEAVRLINDSGYLCIVVTNQPVIARGEVSWCELDAIHAKMETLLGKDGAYIDRIYICPHHPDKGYEGEIPELKFDCECRKPKPGMLLQAARDFNIDLSQSWMIGDSWRDIEAGKVAGTKTVLLDGNEIEDGCINYDRRWNKGGLPTMKVCDLWEATKLILCQYSEEFGVDVEH